VVNNMTIAAAVSESGVEPAGDPFTAGGGPIGSVALIGG